jgi:hypothetical protein
MDFDMESTAFVFVLYIIIDPVAIHRPSSIYDLRTSYDYWRCRYVYHLRRLFKECPQWTSAYNVQIDNGTITSFSAQKTFYRPSKYYSSSQIWALDHTHYQCN